MAEITMKSTKAEIMEAYKAAVEKLDTRDRMIDDPAKEAAKAKKVEVIESADKTAKEDIFNPEIIEKQKIDKWNGDVPKVQGGNAATIVDAGDLTSGTATVKGE